MKKNRAALVLVGLSAIGLWVAGRLKFLTATVSDDKAGDSVKTLVGSVWDPAMVPLALAMIAAVILTLAVEPVIRRFLGGVVAVLAAVASFRSVTLLTSDVDLARARNILASGSATQRATKPVQISEWAQVTDAQVHTMPVVVALVAATLGVIGGVLLLMQPGKASKGHSRYETPENRRAGAKEDLAENPNNSRALWDVMDTGVDPTDDDSDDFTPPTRGR
ncbi:MULTISPECIES: TIGR02234 family membrane protein [Corynebacterium]|uniref:Membrane protein n=1 Tax=Corynebacterium auriscanis TaxID=99807 RepID=A0A0A2DMK2_9CORY|nr:MULTISPECIES: TIGR02234 family membrane protein [Corynebacterium]KGM19164.1 membrane protein [Corynebacterium auriscanis]OFT88392.1 hypothetical protein HMPREF3098_08190 [Corynebacterium sp. HMSC28B08]WJY72523.1 Tryptophan-associated transmembrane protein [Corynebacterium auriscanis]